jgi:hypothetical protein
MTYCIKFSKQINKPEPSFSIVRRVFLWPQFLFYFVLLQLWRDLFEFINTLPKSVEIQVDTRIERGNFEHYKNHPGKNVFRALRIPEYLEETITDVLGSNYTHYNKNLFLLICIEVIYLRQRDSESKSPS